MRISRCHITHLIDHAQLVKTLVDYFEQQMLFVDAILFDLKVVRLQDVVHEIKVLVHLLLRKVSRQDDREQLYELRVVVLPLPLTL